MPSEKMLLIVAYGVRNVSMNVTISVILQRSTLWAHRSDDHGFLLTSPPLVSGFGQQ